MLAALILVKGEDTSMDVAGVNSRDVLPLHHCELSIFG